MAQSTPSDCSIPWVGLSLMPEPAFLETTQPLFAAAEVEVLEWSFDTAWGLEPTLPDRVHYLIQSYSQRDRLLGHGVSYSLLSADDEERQTEWRHLCQQECQRYHYRQVSEHFGWMVAGDFYQSAPLPLPLTPTTLQLGRDRLQRLADQIPVPIGLENLAFAWNLHDAMEQGEFLDRLLEPVNGFLILDLHNLFCQMHNFDRSAPELLDRYPLHRVRELHISGGSWSHTTQQPDRPIRRDTHDHAVPAEVFDLLPLVLQRCPAIESIILERLGHTLDRESERGQFRQDFYHLKQIVQDNKVKPIELNRKEHHQTGAEHNYHHDTLTETDVAIFQANLLDVLYDSPDPDTIQTQLRQLAEPAFQPYIQQFEGRMVEVAAELVKQWGRRYPSEDNEM